MAFEHHQQFIGMQLGSQAHKTPFEDNDIMMKCQQFGSSSPPNLCLE
jgi:hypothetical protein